MPEDWIEKISPLEPKFALTLIEKLAVLGEHPLASALVQRLGCGPPSKIKTNKVPILIDKKSELTIAVSLAPFCRLRRLRSGRPISFATTVH